MASSAPYSLIPDPMGQAISDYYAGRPCERLIVSSPSFEDDEMPVSHLFRTEQEMSALERRALDLCRGRVLDVGAGAGCHSVVLRQRGFDVTSLEISALSAETMRRRGLEKVVQGDVFTQEFPERFDTILLLMNGLGICGTLQRLPVLLRRLASLLAPGGRIVTDACDLRPVFTDDDGTFHAEDFDGYYGEVTFRMRYGGCRGKMFSWLYVDERTLAETARRTGMQTEVVLRGDDEDYLAVLTAC